ncbi:hypothetical protein BDW62DRAFT_160253 [Aspergillus aurantiobrunneus]
MVSKRTVLRHPHSHPSRTTAPQHQFGALAVIAIRAWASPNHAIFGSLAMWESPRCSSELLQKPADELHSHETIFDNNVKGQDFLDLNANLPCRSLFKRWRVETNRAATRRT